MGTTGHFFRFMVNQLSYCSCLILRSPTVKNGSVELGFTPVLIIITSTSLVSTRRRGTGNFLVHHHNRLSQTSGIEGEREEEHEGMINGSVWKGGGKINLAQKEHI